MLPRLPCQSLVIAVLLGLQGGCQAINPPPKETYRVLRVLRHDPQAFTQGLVFLDGRLFESTGQYGHSSIRELDPTTGAVLRSRDLDKKYFGEGLAAVQGHLVQLTWKAGIAFAIDPASFDVTHTYPYDGEGWGLCSDGSAVFMSNGTDTLYQRNPQSFAIEKRIPVTEAGFPVRRLNELECIGQTILANVFESDKIVRIDKATGKVVSEIDGYGLAGSGDQPDNASAVLNGIAYDSAKDTYFITGKLWPSLLEITLRDQ